MKNKLTTLTNFDLIDLAKKMNIKLDGVLSKDEITKSMKGQFFIINLDDSYEPTNGTHWTALIHLHNEWVYFDSFGCVGPNIIEKLSKNYLYTKDQVQDIEATSCGWWCLYFLYYFQYNFQSTNLNTYKQFMAMFSCNTVKNEKILLNLFD